MTTLLITCGDPNGIGLEVCVKALLRLAPEFRGSVRVHLAVSTALFWEYVEHLQVPVRRTESGFAVGGLECDFVECGNQTPFEPGVETKAGGELALAALETAARELREGRADAVCTMPVSKRALYLAGSTFPGQTEFFANRFGVDKPMMILCTEATDGKAARPAVRVGLATIHIPLANVASALTQRGIEERLHALHTSLKQDFALATPRIAVLGLNPHAGEQGAIGMEEQTMIQPAIAAARERGIQAEGAFPADGFFAHGGYKHFDGILAMYHDQGLIPLKLLAGGAGVNFSAGLPIVRTSPDHGTAFALAGKGVADESSAVEAMQMAVRIVGNRHTMQ
jgi:4-hydroxythreonine-4-phosphate dehydrogenase